MQPSRRALIPPFMAMDVLSEANRLAAAGKRIFHLETGQPSTTAPAPALAAAKAALQTDTLGYTEALGQPALKSAILEQYRENYGLDIDPRRVVVTTGSSAGFILAFLAAFDAGHRVVMGVPGYPAYRNTATALNLDPVLVAAGPENDFQLNQQELSRVAGAQGLLLGSPANPTGTVIAHEEFASLIDLARGKGWRVISDEIYHGLTYGARSPCALSYDPDAIVINSFSKYYSMTGWRIGWMIVPEPLVRTVERLAQNLFISPPAISQIAAKAALSLEAKPELDGHVSMYARNRKVLMTALREGGLTRFAPADGAFYLYAGVDSVCADSRDLTKALLAEAGVAATPGWDFDPHNGGAWVRFSYAGSEREVVAAAEVLKLWLARR